MRGPFPQQQEQAALQEVPGFTDGPGHDTVGVRGAGRRPQVPAGPCHVHPRLIDAADTESDISITGSTHMIVITPTPAPRFRPASGGGGADEARPLAPGTT
ncbi:hypothetical protein GCM10023196_051390 [Actinoallomurus vinaceus]|uniref:Uncharacterized protein n=1 Tax=Actinoallomurus vinaceus TaxID=1080074 RepID=A0ABP8UES1_9ACTN